ncbi:hypothetical protein JOQ06_019250, partial [Pogonophryne albipinna]
MNSITGRVLAIPAASVTSSGASSSRALHVELTSQQRRLRHLRSIAARNIVNKNGSPLLDTYFTLHLCIGERISRDFYKSEVIRDSLNPTWRSLDFGMLPDLLDTSVSCFVVRIWGGQEEQFQLLIEWKVNLDGLRYTGQQIRSRNPNEIIFGLNDGYYAADFDHKDQSERKKNSLLQVDLSSVRNSYSVFSLLRHSSDLLARWLDAESLSHAMLVWSCSWPKYLEWIPLPSAQSWSKYLEWIPLPSAQSWPKYLELHTAQRAIKQTQVTVQRIGKEIEEKLRTTATCTERKPGTRVSGALCGSSKGFPLCLWRAQNYPSVRVIVSVDQRGQSGGHQPQHMALSPSHPRSTINLEHMVGETPEESCGYKESKTNTPLEWMGFIVVSLTPGCKKKERECMQLRIAVLRSELQRQRKALGREMDLRQKESARLQKKGNCPFSKDVAQKTQTHSCGSAGVCVH